LLTFEKEKYPEYDNFLEFKFDLKFEKETDFIAYKDCFANLEPFPESEFQ
jgi:hypothetical protein